MAKRASGGIPSCPLYIGIKGDLGLLTTWTGRKSGRTAMLKSPPKEPPSPKQVAWRTFFGSKVAEWRALTTEQKADYERATIDLRLIMTGYDLWMKCSLTGNWYDVKRCNQLLPYTLYIP